MKITIVNANIVMPDQDKILDLSSLVVENGLITRVDKGVQYRFDYGSDFLINAEENYLMPGMINTHSHGFTLGPLFPSASKPITFPLIFRNLNEHLLQGTTTLLNVDGFALMEEVDAINKLHPINIKTGTTHMPLSFEAAEQADGKGLTKAHKAMTVEQMLERGSSAIGEVGAGATLGGGVASYYLLPKAIEEKTGKRITAAQAEQIKIAVLGRHIDPANQDKKKVESWLAETALADSLTVDEAIEITMKVIYSSVEVARNDIREAADFALKHDVPVIVHNAAASKDVVLEIANRLGSKLIAGHSNHPSYTKEEMLAVARELKKSGAIIDIVSGDSFGANQLCGPGYMESTLAMFEEGLGDTITTDFMGGNWDSMLRVLEEAVNKKKISLPKAVAMGTSNVVKAIPRVAPNAGVIGEGKAADLIIVDKNKISNVKYVIINGLPVLVNGQMKFPNPNWIW